MPWIIVGAGGVLLIVLTPLVAYLGHDATKLKRAGSGRMWGWYSITFEILGATLLLAWAQAHVSGDTAKEPLAFMTLVGAFSWVLAGARFGAAFQTVWRGPVGNSRPPRDE